MTVRVDADQVGTESTPVLPNENRTLHLAAAAVIIGISSFVTLLLLPSWIHFGGTRCLVGPRQELRG
jgi:hypothetical protein